MSRTAETDPPPGGFASEPGEDATPSARTRSRSSSVEPRGATWKRRWARAHRPIREWTRTAPPFEWAVAVLGIGLLIRLLLAPITNDSDVSTFASSSVTMVYGGGPYTFIIDYPIGWVLLLNLIGRSAELFVPAYGLLQTALPLYALRATLGIVEVPYIPAPAYLLAEKIPLFLFDALTGYLIYQILWEYRSDRYLARVGFMVWFFNPLVLSQSAVHGAYDVVPAFFALAAVYLAIHGRALSSGAALGLGVVTKLFPIFLVPLIVVLLWRRHPRLDLSFLRSVALGLAGLAAMVAIVFWPGGVASVYVEYLATNPVVGVNHGTFGVWTFVQLPGMALFRWWLYYHSVYVAIACDAAAAVLILWGSFRYARLPRSQGLSLLPWVNAFVFTMIASLVQFAAVQVQYFIWFLPELVLLAVIDRRFRWPLVLISTFGTVYYFFAIAGPTYLLQPFALNTPWFSPSALVASIGVWKPMTIYFLLPLTIGISFVLAYVAVRLFHELRTPEPSA